MHASSCSGPLPHISQSNYPSHHFSISLSCHFVNYCLYLTLLSPSFQPPSTHMPYLPTTPTYEPSHTLLSNTRARAPPPPIATFAQILTIMGSPAQCTSVLPVGNQHQDMLHIIVWQPNVISVTNEDTLTMSAIFRSVEDVTPQGMWSITAQSIPLPNHILDALTMGPTPMTMTSTPLWMMTEKAKNVEPGAQVYKGGNVTISFLSHIFFLVSVVCHPYFCFMPLYEETDFYLLAFPSYSIPFIVPL